MPSSHPVALVTGASSGIGKEVAIALAAQGWRVIGTGRNIERMSTAKKEIERRASGNVQVDMIKANLSLMSDVEELAQAVIKTTDRLDVLVNNAGGMTNKLEVTSEGLEANFAGNHLGPFLLTERLLPLMKQTARAQIHGSVRILFTTSDASEMLPHLNLDDLQNIEHFNPGMAYCTGKLANVIHACELSRRLEGTGIVTHAVHPGPVDTNFYSTVPDDTRERTDSLDKFSTADGADTLVWLATAEEGAQHSGSYWYQRSVRDPNPIVHDAEKRRRFWQESERLVHSAKK